VTVSFYSYFKDLAACAETTETLPDGSTLDDLVKALAARFPKFGAMQRSALVAVGLDYQPRSYVLRPGDAVALFPPVQGG
jgi:molybdopterin converting factor small subunit